MRASVCVRVLGVIWLSFGLACVAQAPTDGVGPLKTLLDEDWKYWMTQYPETATAVGYPGQDARWTDYSPAAVSAREQYLRQSLDRLKGVDRSRLQRGDLLTFELYRDMIETAVRGLEFGNDAIPIRSVIPHNLLMPLNQLEGVQQDIPRTIALMPAASPADYENIVKRLEGVPALVDQTIAWMQKGLEQGLTPTRVAVRALPSQVEGQIVADAMKSPLLAAFSSRPASIGEPDRARLGQQAAAAYANAVKPAFTRLRDFLVSTYLPACRETIGASTLAKGVAMYEYNIRWHTTTGQTPGEIHAIGQTEVKRIRAEMDQVMARAAFKGSFDDFKRYLRTNPQFFFKDAASLVSAYRDVAKRADPTLARLFGTLPRTPYGVLAVPDAIAPSQTTAYYEPGAPDVGRPGYMYANTYKLDSRPKWEMEALTLHEAVPGHHLQIALSQELEGLPEFRKHSSYTAFVEGWALYAESLGDEMNFYRDPYSKFGQLTYEMWRAVRLVVDTGLHSMSWTRQQAIDFFLANTAKAEQDITVEVDRYIVWPGQALGYKIGQLKIRELRAKAERQLGASFNIRKFHDAVLLQGALPLDVLEGRVAEWMASVNPR